MQGFTDASGATSFNYVCSKGDLAPTTVFSCAVTTCGVYDSVVERIACSGTDVLVSAQACNSDKGAADFCTRSRCCAAAILPPPVNPPVASTTCGDYNSNVAAISCTGTDTLDTTKV